MIKGRIWTTKWNKHVNMGGTGVYTLTDNWVILFMHIVYNDLLTLQ